MSGRTVAYLSVGLDVARSTLGHSTSVFCHYSYGLNFN